jgi:uncharacterized membrane protein YkoI
MKAYQLLLPGYLLLILLLPVQPVLGANQENQPQNSLFPPGAQQDEPQTRISARQASDIARASYGGKVINVRPDRRVWRVRMDLDGRVVDVIVDADSGAVSRPSE